jgi:hypothetical protein
MKYLFLFIFLILSLKASEIVELKDKRYKNSSNCKACHLHLVKDWENSWHAKSHYKNDEYFQKSINYIARKTRQDRKKVQIECAKCHNPRITVSHLDETYNLLASIGLADDKKIKKAINDDTLKEGINCLVCHNIDKIYNNLPSNIRGMDRVKWTKNGLMSGPYKNSKSPYHKVEYRDFMDKNPNKLCFVCHANDKAVVKNGLTFTNMQKEYKGKEKCVECHMGPKKLSYASSYRFKGQNVKKRMIRNHKFIGAHTKEMWRDVLKISLKQNKKDISIIIKNPTPHNIPSGFGSREILVDISYKRGIKEISHKTISLTTHYKRKRNKISIPHLALKVSKDLSIPAKGTKIIKIAKNPKATSIEIKLFYRLVNDEVRNLLKLEQKIWKQKFFITSKTLNLI